eukprot:CAMPEP_0197275096 /NCGR_PEP_ID=MMETSP1432-20130617/13501_1 /TAXON_ID=44447 /ORGANISM="Pseudo-nitzschia delicatissima, Strain UNC1205" /LENGTH=296 /DNA_ID=CAMNT_0042740967 /DNA_START=1 /DNA_END=891 /DNA_ORIENTATION=+
MMFNNRAIPLLLVTICHTSIAWTTLQTSQAIKGVASPSIASKNPLLLGLPTVRTPLTRLSETAGEGDIPKRKRKRKKKVVVEEDDDDDEPEVAATAAAVVETVAPIVVEEAEPAPVLELKPRDDTPVQFQVTNILASDEPPEPSNLSKVSDMLLSFTSGKEEPKSTRSESSGPKFESRPMDDSMSQLLEDVKVMTEEEKMAAEESGGFFSDSNGTGIKQMIGDALSTIVTVDFFVVLGFLLWFLLGIASRSVFNDDTIQIAFNNNFEKLVQPALGVLMIASLGGSFFNEKEEEYDL